MGGTALVTADLFHQVHPSGKSFSVHDGEGKPATVELSDPVGSVGHPRAALRALGLESGLCWDALLELESNGVDLLRLSTALK